MKLLIYSDLHLEWSAFEPDRSAVNTADVVVLAGDIWTGSQGVAWAQKIFGNKPVVYVAGNHEFYGTRCPEQLTEMRALAAGTNVRFLDCEAVEIDGVWFLGATLWTDYELHAEPGDSTAMRAVERQVAMGNIQRQIQDHKSIRASTGSHGKWRPAHAYEQHIEARAWLASTLAELHMCAPQKHRIVVTHHAPAAASLGDRLTDSVSPAYASRLPASAFQGVDAWIHGHIHLSQDYRHHHGCRVISNPRGYPRKPLFGRDYDEAAGHENSGFEPSRIVEV